MKDFHLHSTSSFEFFHHGNDDQSAISPAHLVALAFSNSVRLKSLEHCGYLLFWSISIPVQIAAFRNISVIGSLQSPPRLPLELPSLSMTATLPQKKGLQGNWIRKTLQWFLLCRLKNAFGVSIRISYFFSEITPLIARVEYSSSRQNICHKPWHYVPGSIPRMIFPLFFFLFFAHPAS